MIANENQVSLARAASTSLRSGKWLFPIRRRSSVVTLASAAVLLVAPIASRGDIVYVSNYGSNTITRYDSITGGVLGVFARTGLNMPTGMAFDQAGNLYVGNWGDGTIDKITPSGVSSVFFNTGSYPNALAFDGSGNLYVAIWRGWIEKITPNGVGSVFASLDAATGLAFDRAGNLYASSADNVIEKYTPGGVASVFASTGLSEPWGLSFDSGGNLYAANDSNNTIEKFTPGGIGSVFATNGLLTPQGLAIDSKGNLFAANFYGYGKSVEKFTPGGVASVFANTGFNSYSDYVAIAPIPEPSACALLGLGLPALFALRRSRTDRAVRGIDDKRT